MFDSSGRLDLTNSFITGLRLAANPKVASVNLPELRPLNRSLRWHRRRWLIFRDSRPRANRHECCDRKSPWKWSMRVSASCFPPPAS